MPLSVGSKLGPYEILAPIGAGGMGEVYRARDTKLDRDVAIKVLPAALAQDPERLARFEREAKVLASLNHPNIAQIYGIEDRALVMELVAGETLQGPLSLETALNYARQIADALEAAHDKNIIHRDLKPANIMVTPAGVVKVLDFGLAAVAQSSDPSNPANSPTLTISPTRAGMILGTASYMSPEQARGKTVDKRADIWAFGVVLYEMLTGKPLFEGETVSDTLAQVLTGEPDWEQVPAKVRRLLKKCLEKDPKKRLRDIGDAWELLEEGEPATTARSRSRVAWVAWTMVGVFAVVAAAVGFIHFREAPPELRLVRFQIPPRGKSAIGVFNLSPDGRWLVFPSGGKLWLRALDSLQAQPLPGTELDASLGLEDGFWSPDSQYIAFASQGKLKKISVAGGPAQTLCDVTMLIGGTWNRDGVILFGDFLGLWRVPEAGGAPVQVIMPGIASFPISPDFLPDGRHFLYTIIGDKAEANGVYVGLLDGRQHQAGQRLLPDASNVSYAPAFAPGTGAAGRSGYLLFERGGTLMAQPFDPVRLALTGAASLVADGVARKRDVGLFSVSNNGTLAYLPGGTATTVQLVWKDRTGKSTGTFGPPGVYDDFRLAPDEKRIAFETSQSGNDDVWALDSVRGTTSRLTFDPAGDNVPMWSADGLRIVWASTRGGGGVDLYIKAANGTGKEDLLVKMGTPLGWASDWSRDGRYLLYQRPGEKTGQDLWIAPQLPEGVSGDRKPFPYLQSEFDESEGKFSPDGRWVAYVSNESGRNEIYVQSFPLSGAKFQISTGGGAQPQWRKDGGELFYVAPDQMLMAVSVKLGRPPAEPFQAGKSPKPLFAVQSYSVRLIGRDYAVSNDGQKFLVPSLDEAAESQPMTVVLNWQAGLKK